MRLRAVPGSPFPGYGALRDYLDAFLVAGLVLLFCITFLIRPFYIPSTSMLPTLHVGDVLFVDELSYRLHAPRPGDVAVFASPVDAQNDFIKRVIGLPGDRIAIRGGIVYRNGIALDEPYIQQAPEYSLRIAHDDIVVDGEPLDPHSANIPAKPLWQQANRIPRGCYLMLGDNRNNSDDSHVWGFAQRRGIYLAGPLAGRARTGFVGRAFLIVWPLSRLQIPR